MKRIGRSPYLATVLLLLSAVLLSSCGQTRSPAAGAVAQPDAASASAEPPAAGAESTATTTGPQVIANAQIFDGTYVVVAKVISKGPGWMAIHKQENGHLGSVVGYTRVDDGENDNVVVKLDPAQPTGELYAMLHVDAGTVGTYEFPGPDTPVVVGGEMVAPPFMATVAKSAASIPKAVAHDQDTSTGQVVVDEVVSSGPGWVAIHIQNADGTAGPEIGYAPVKDGMNGKVTVTIDASRATPVLMAMLHIDAGELGTYEYPGPDLPAIFGGQDVASAFRATNLQAAVAAPTQAALAEASAPPPANASETTAMLEAATEAPTAADSMTMAMTSPGAAGSTATPTLAAVAGTSGAMSASMDSMTATVPALASSTPLAVPLSAGAATATPAAANSMAMAMVTPIPGISPVVNVTDQTITDGMVKIDDVVSSGPGWLVVYSMNNGQPDEPIGFSPVSSGDNPNVMVRVNAAKATGSLYAQLHVDAGQIGVFEFPGPDAPLMVGVRMIAKQFTSISGPPSAAPSRAPSISVQDQPIHNGTVVVAQVVSTGEQWLVIHRQNPDGSLGDYIGFAPLHEGVNNNVLVRIDLARTTRVLNAMLHVNASKGSAPQFPGVDVPVTVGGQVLLPKFQITGALTGDVPLTLAKTGSGELYLADGWGRSLYLYLNDTPGKSNCTGDCLKSFRPFLASGAIVPGAGLAVDKIRVTILADGSRQIVYGGAPLYYSIDDRQPGDAFGQGTDGLWFLVTP